jgi:hypothetical protein
MISAYGTVTQFVHWTREMEFHGPEFRTRNSDVVKYGTGIPRNFNPTQSLHEYHFEFRENPVIFIGILLNSRQFFIHEQIGLEFHGIPIPEFIGIPHFKVKTPEFHIPTLDPISSRKRFVYCHTMSTFHPIILTVFKIP